MEVIFSNLRCSAGDKDILKTVSGKIGRTRMVCIMGPTGAGKSTLLNAIAHKQPQLLRGGSVSYDGKRWDQKLRKSIGFVEQDDVVFNELTVQRSLMFTARLRLPANWSRKRKEERVNTLIASLNLQKCANTKIATISGGERKRLCIAAECLVQPQLLLLDEPTSGLDSTTAVTVVKLLRNLAGGASAASSNAQHGESSKGSSDESHLATDERLRQKTLRVSGITDNVTIACTIHQPSSQIFNLFDDLLFVDNGDIVYFGPCRDLVPTMAYVGFKLPPNYSPADFMMDVMSLGEVDQKNREALIRIQLSHARDSTDPADREHLQSIIVNASSEDANDNWEPAGFFEQVWILSERQAVMSFPDVFTWTNLFLYLAQTFLAGVLWFPVRDDFSEDSLFARMSFVFWTVGTWTFFPMFGSLHIFNAKLTNLKKELSVASYSLFAYFTAVTSVVIPIDLFWTLLYLPITYAMANLGQSAEEFFAFFACVWLNILVMQAIGLAIATLFLASANGFVFAICLTTFFFGFGGLFVPLSTMGPIAGLRYINVLAYSFHLHMEAVFGMDGFGQNYTCSTTGSSGFEQCTGFNNSCATVAATANATRGNATITGQDVLHFFDIPEDAVVVSLSVLICLVLFLRLVSYSVLHIRLICDGTLDNRSLENKSRSQPSGVEMIQMEKVNSDASAEERSASKRAENTNSSSNGSAFEQELESKADVKSKAEVDTKKGEQAVDDQ